MKIYSSIKAIAPDMFKNLQSSLDVFYSINIHAWVGKY